jgi:rod shape-determining protein MreC
MRNLWLLLQRNAFALAFIALMALSLSVLFRNSGAARSSWYRQTGSIASRVEQQRSQWSNYLHLSEQNTRLARENAALRSRLLSMEITGDWRVDSLRGWGVREGTLIKGPDGTPHSFALASPGEDGAISPGMGVLAGGSAYGTVEDVGEAHCRILTLMHAASHWSCRIGRNGPVASLNWDGKDMGRLLLEDVPRHVMAEAGDTVFTSGYDLRFPPGIPMGFVLSTDRTSGADFVSIDVDPAVDFRTTRYIDIILSRSDSERVELALPQDLP